MPPTSKALGKRVAGEEVIESAIVVPGCNQCEPAGTGPGYRSVAEGEAQGRL